MLKKIEKISRVKWLKSHAVWSCELKKPIDESKNMWILLFDIGIKDFLLYIAIHFRVQKSMGMLINAIEMWLIYLF